MGVGAWMPDRPIQGVVNTRLNAIRDSQGRPLSLVVTANQVSDYIRLRTHKRDSRVC